MPTPNKPLTDSLIANPSLHRLAMRIGQTGMDVAITSRVHDNVLIQRHIPFSTAHTDPLRRLEEAIYANPLLTSDFGHTHIVADTKRFFLLPHQQAADVTAVKRYADSLYPPENTHIPLENVVIPVETDRSSLIMCADKNILRFVRRTWNTPDITHRMAVLSRYHTLRGHLGNSGKIHVMLTPGRTDIIATGSNGLLMANTFATQSATDSLYYTMAAARNLGFDNDSDRLLVNGTPALRDEFIALARKFVPFVMPEITPSVVTALGQEASRAPFELLILPLCE